MLTVIILSEVYSMDGHSGRRMYYDRAYDDGPEGSSGDYSRRGRGPGAKRDSMGRYSSRGYAMDDYRD